MSETLPNTSTPESSREPEVTLAREVGELAVSGAPEEAEAIEKTEYEVLDVAFLRNESPEDLRQRYIYLTDRLIKRFCGYGDPEDRPDTVIFLDKSARPVSWLVREFWDEFADRDPETGEAMKMPEFKFLNIDKDDWIDAGDREQQPGSPIVHWNGKHQAGPESMRSLRSVFLEREPQEGERPMDIPTMLDGKKVMVVDEVQSTGLTKRLAEKLVSEAYPEAEVEGAYWMPSTMQQVRGGYQQLDNPIWYDANTAAGRGVGPRNIEKSKQSDSWRNRRGAAFLSTAPAQKDTLAEQLRSDIKLLHKEYESGAITVPENYDISKVYSRAKGSR